MKNLYRILRSVVVALLCLCVVSPAVIFVALSLPGVQGRIARVCEKELSGLLGCEVTVGDLGIIPFNRVVLRNVTVVTAPGDTALTVRRLGAGVRIGSLLGDGPFTVNYVEINGMRARLWRDSIGAPLNIQPIIDALSPKDKNKPPTRMDFRINTVMVRSSAISYHEGLLPAIADGERRRFSPQHVEIAHLRADVRLPRLRNEDIAVEIKRMGFEETLSGFAVNNLAGRGKIMPDSLNLSGVRLEMPHTDLRLPDMGLHVAGGMKHVAEALRSGRHRAGVEPGSYLGLSDLAAFVPELAAIPLEVRVNALEATGNTEDFSYRLDLAAGEHTSVESHGEVRYLADNERRSVELQSLALRTSASEAGDVAQQLGLIDGKTLSLLAWAGDVAVDGKGMLDGRAVDAAMALSAATGKMKATVSGTYTDPNRFALDAHAVTDGALDLAAVTGDLQLQSVEGDVTASLRRSGKRMDGMADVELDHVTYRGVAYDGLKAHATLEDRIVRGTVGIDNEALAFHAEGAWGLDPRSRLVELDATLDRIVPSALNLTDKWEGTELSGSAQVALEGEDFNHMQGMASINRLTIRRADGEEFVLHNFLLNAIPSRLTVRSDFFDGELTGYYDFSSMWTDVRRVLSKVLPAVFPSEEQPLTARRGRRAAEEPKYINDFRLNFTVKETERAAAFFKLPVSVVYPVQISGNFSAPDSDMSLNLRAPFLRQGKKLIENTNLTVSAGDGDRAAVVAATTMPTKNGPMRLLLTADGADDCVSSSVAWKIERDRAYEGSVEATASFSRPEEGDGTLLTTVDLHRSSLTFNDSTWIVNPAEIRLYGLKHIEVDGLDVHRANQFVRIHGVVDADPWQQLTLDLRNFSLDYLFETLGIEKVMLGGDATGTFTASGLLTSEPVLQTPGLHVKNISYNRTVLGDAVVRSHWDNEQRAVTLDADIDSDGGHRSRIDGAIYPMADSLDITFRVDRVNIAFMRPYMQAFASDISGLASGRARLFGTFKYVDLEGDVYADSLRLKINFTNTYYTAKDSVHFRPGVIDLDNIRLTDSEGHTARLNGWLHHKFFKEPSFEFTVSDARDMLCYNTTARDNPVWYGKIYGNGSVAVKGAPGVVGISVDMSTAPRSVFTFVLSDREEAEELSFLTFRDKGKLSGELTDTIELRDPSMDLVNRLRQQVEQATDDSPSDYNISLQMRVTPEAQLNLVMDPVGGDRIRAYGSGHLRLDYGSANNDLRMYGTYTLSRGSYNFTLQDIIIKDFTIKPDSRISFNGDPYNAALDIQAIYALNANLSDLDESFLQDKDLNRTNVPVHAVLKVSGDLVAPDISFDLEFPTLTTDVYRKVRSIISTDDMMNRQIIYLLALNRFYTPDYMASTTKGNELVSVASSTISSQLSNLLGSLSENWNIAPTFRSDRGDFSDVEVDVALSSRLLNNRLLFNGNFGYRDNALNSSQFVGDFDLEYLLDRPGMWRLKAYNRYNDQNYYLRTAPTTQGVGIVLRKDFDSFFSFLRPLFHRRKKEQTPPQVPDSTAVELPDKPAVKAAVKPVPRKK